MTKMNSIIVFLIIFCINYIFCDNDFTETVEEKRNKFISEGFGFKYDETEMSDINIFILNHGKPLNILEEIIRNRYDEINDKLVTIEYENIIVKFYVWSKRNTGVFPISMLLSIQSKDEANYLYNIKHGLTINELEKIIGKIYFLRGDDTFALFENNRSNVMIICFLDNRIESIIWHHSLE
jgi:hypothetical protein